MDQRPMETSFFIIMQDLGSDYIQKPGISHQEAKVVMESLARLNII